MPTGSQPLPAPERAQRGASLIITLVVIVVLTLIALAAVNRGFVEVESAGMRRRYQSSVSCVEAARDLVVSQLIMAGSQVNQVQLSRQVGDLTLSTGHYDSGPAGQVRQDTTFGNCNSGGGLGGGFSTGDLTNVNWNASGSGGSGNSCGVRIPVVCRDSAGRALELEFLVRLAL